MKIVRKIVVLSIIIGVIGLALTLVFGNETTTYIERYKFAVTNDYYYKFNYLNYFRNLELSITDTTRLNLELPTRVWQDLSANNFGNALGNDMALILDYILLIINVLLYPMRIGAYILKNLTALIGINQEISEKNGLSWLIQLINWLIERIAIPYI